MKSTSQASGKTREEGRNCETHTWHERTRSDFCQHTHTQMNTYRDLLDELVDFRQVLLGSLVGKVGVGFLEGLGLVLEEGAKLFDVLVPDLCVEGVPRVHAQDHGQRLARFLPSGTVIGLVGFVVFGIEGLEGDLDEGPFDADHLVQQSLVGEGGDHGGDHVDLAVKDHHGEVVRRQLGGNVLGATSSHSG